MFQFSTSLNHFMIDIITENENPFHAWDISIYTLGIHHAFYIRRVEYDGMVCHQHFATRKEYNLLTERFVRYYGDCYNPLKNKPWNKHNLQI